MSLLSASASYVSVNHKGTPLLWIAMFLLSGALPCLAQGPSGREWAERLDRSVLVLVYPSYAVKHQRIRSALQDLPADGAARRRGERQIALEEAGRDTLLAALSLSFQAYYSLGEVLFMADTTYIRHWQKGQYAVPLLEPDLRPRAARTLDPVQVLILRQRDTDRDTGTGITVWALETGDQSAWPPRFPDTFSNSGNLGHRFLGFFQAMFRSSLRPDRLGEIRPTTDYLAKQVQKKWGRYLERMGY